MRDKYANKSPAMRFFHRYTGYITVAIFLGIVIPAWLYYDSTQFFFEGWDCGTINQYLLTGNDFGFTPHDKLTEDEHIRIHEIYEQCNDQFSDGILPPH